MSNLDRSACARSVIEATPYNQMFVSWIFNFLVNLRKIICLEPNMKLDSIVNEVFLYQNMYFCAADFSLLNLPKGKSLGRSKPAANS
jgi:hypothetical protein